MNDIQIIKQNPKKVLDALKIGEIERIDLSFAYFAHNMINSF